MKNILFATNSAHINCQAMEFACYIATVTRSKLKGVFLENSLDPHVPVAERMSTILAGGDLLEGPGITGNETREELSEKNIQFFEAFCDKKGLRHGIHRDRNIPLQEILAESRFADLIIIDAGTSFEKNDEDVPSHFVKALLHQSECPVIIAPERYTDIDEIVFAYDGSASSVHAIKQFIHLFTAFEDKRVTVVEVEEEPDSIKNKHNISELLRGYYSKIGYEVLQGNPAEQLFDYLVKRQKTMLVMGAFGRGYVSSFFKKSAANLVVRALPLPIFIAHS